MPESVAAWIASATLTASSTLTYSQIVALTYAGFAVATVGVGEHQRKKRVRAARDSFNASLQDRLVMTSTAQAPRSRVYGRVRNVDGIVFKRTHGANSEFYTLVVALAGHQVDAIEQVWFNDAPVTLDGAGNVTTAPWAVGTRQSASVEMTVTGGAGSVTLPVAPAAGTTPVASFQGSVDQTGSPGFVLTHPGTMAGLVFTIAAPAPHDGVWRVTYETDAVDSKARVRAYTGAPGQNLYADLDALVGSGVQTTDRFEGIACLLVTLKYDQDAFASGVPNISAVMRGARVFDPRTSTTAWSQSPALIARDWSLYANGGACVDAELNGPSFEAAANACDVTTVFTTGTGTETRPLYQCGIVVPLDSNPDEALGEICEAMAGQWGWAGGRLSVRAGVYRAPVATITEDWIAGTEDIQIQPSAATAEAVNVLRPTLADAAQGYASAPAAEVRADAYITADGRELVEELQLAGVVHAVHAQHVCGVLMRERRESLTLRLPCNLRAYPLELFDVVQVTLPRFGWAAKLFEVVGWAFSLTGGVVLTLRETAAAIYTPDAVFDVLTTSPNTALPRPARPAQLGSLTATSGSVAQVDGSSLARVSLAWPAVTDEAVRQSGQIEIQYAEIGPAINAVDWPAAPPVAGAATVADIVGLRIGYPYMIRARAVNTLGMRGPWRAVFHVVSGRRAPIIWRQASAPSGASVQDGDEWVDTDDSNRRYVREAGSWVDVRDAGIAAALANAAAAQATADGKIDSFWQTTAPATAAEGDLWFDTDDGARQYRWTSGAWVVAADTRIGTAISNAATAQATADGKVRTYVQTTAPAASAVGDLWLDSDDGYRMYRWSGGAWLDVRDAGIASALATAAAAQATADGKIDSFWQPTAPATAAEGDLWFDTDDGAKQYRYTGGTWVVAADTRIGTAISNAATAQATADGKVRTYVQTTAPTAEAVGDLWLDSDDGYRMYRWTGSAWADVRDTGIADALTSAAAAQATADGKIDSFWQASAPGAASEGDIWFDTDDGLRQYRYTGGTWVVAADSRIGTAISDAATAQATADGKVTTFVGASAPTAEAVGDLWLDTGNGNRLNRWSGSAWVQVPIGTGGLAPGAATAVTFDEHDFAGATVTTGTNVQRTLVVTPDVDSWVEFGAQIAATNVVGDSGNRLGWGVTPAGGSRVTLGGTQISTTAKQLISAVSAFEADAGVALTFDITTERATGNPAQALFQSYMRVTVIKR
jgi:frataxin-like iron-binding protein CyaY